MYLLRVVEALGAHPNAKIPRVLFPAADPLDVVALDAVAEPLVSQAYVYLLRVVDALDKDTRPSANIPRVLFPAADPYHDAALAAVAEPLVSQA